MTEPNNQTSQTGARPQAAQPVRRRKPRVKYGKFVALLLLMCAVAVGSVLIYKNIFDKSEPTPADVKSQVSKLFLTMPDEDPVVVKVEKVEEISNNAFFSKAENGDQLLIFTNSGTSIIYRPSTNQIVNAGAIVNDAVEDAS